MIELHEHFIDGAWVDGGWTEGGGEPFVLRDPATEEPAMSVAMGGEATVDRAVAAAVAAADGWARTPVEERAALLERMIAIYRERARDFARAMTLEMGCPATLSREVQAPCGDGHLLATLEALHAHRWERPSARGGSLLLDEPAGVCALVTPWNWPVNQVVVKVAPALAAGCTMVLKPSEHAPLSAVMWAELMEEAEAPPGVFNMVLGDAEAGARLVEHPDVALVSFTGSTRAGQAIARAAADTVKRVALELGGKSANLLFADVADAPGGLEAAVTRSVRAVCSNSGQDCDAPSRLLVERAVYDEVVELAARAADAVRVGDPKREGDHLGPVANEKQWHHVQRMIEVGEGEARLVAGGAGRPDGMARGWFVRPTVFADADPASDIAQEEVFGPVLTVMPFESEDEGVAIANATPYGLAAFVQTGDEARALRVARRLHAGTVNVNGAAYDYDVPFGGTKRSGYGRENGAFGLEEYVQTKAVTLG